MKRYAALLALLWLGLFPLAGGASEKILLFSARGTLSEKAALEVREDITVNVEGQQIRRGIYRDFPTKYQGAHGTTVKVGFSVEGALLDGRKVPYKTESLSNGVRIYLGDPKSMAPHGEHTYTLIYTTTGQVGFFARHDELYWNVTGNGWVFPIEKARFSLSLPGNAPFSSLEFYTGPQGARGKNARIVGRDTVETTAPLGPREGLTVVYTWPKGLVTPPPVPLGVRFMARHRGHLLLALPLAFLLVYVLLWLRWGKDPPLGTIIPRFNLPQGTSPGFLRYVNRMGMDNTCFAAEILHLGVQGYLLIEELNPEELLKRKGWGGGLFGGLTSLAVRLGGTTYLLKRTDKRSSSKKPESLLLSALFSRHGEELFLRQENHELLGDAKERLEDYYKQRGKAFFSKHTFLWLLGTLAPLPLLLLFVWGGTPDLALLVLFLGVIFTLGGFWACRSVAVFKRKGFFRKLFKGLLPLFGLVFLLLVVFGIAGPECVGFPLSALAVAVQVVLFRELMTIRTPKGNDLFAHIKGLVMYMNTAERHRLEMMHPPEATPEHFEALLPAAFALDTAETWANRFEDVLKTREYEPSWYRGGNIYSFYTGAGVSALTSGVSNSIASASRAPGSSSGAGGGGCSGGGGGGGGGGGW